MKSSIRHLVLAIVNGKCFCLTYPAVPDNDTAGPNIFLSGTIRLQKKIHNNADLSLRSMFTFSRPVTALLMDVFIGVNCGGGGALLLSESVRMCRPLDPLFSPRVDPPVGYSKVKHTPVGYYFFIWSHSLGEICEIFISSHSGWDKTSSRWYFGRLILNRFGVKCFPPPHTPPHTPPPPPPPG